MRAFLISLLLFGLCGLFFYTFSQIDIEVSKLFYQNGFKNTYFFQFIYKATMIVITLFTLGLLGLFFYNLFSKKELITQKVVIYLLLVLLTAPGLIVNELFKNHFGRARPSQIIQFGGSKKFTPAFVITNQCHKNCSFMSGHAAAAFYFLAFVPLFKGKKKLFIAIVAITWGLLVGVVRIMQGGHFLSDVICSGGIVWLVSLLFYILLFERKRG